jgi:chromosome partitioning protein
MPVILIANPKGGSCKSTLATHVAGLLAREGLSVMLGDVDRQQSARQWLAMRPAEVPPIQSWELDADQVLRPPRGTSHVVIDTPAGLQGELLETLLKTADKVLVPVQASLFDIRPTHAFLEALQQHRRRRDFDVGVVAMRVREGTHAQDRLDEYLAGIPVPVVARVRDTQNYVHLAAHGLTLWDVTPSRVERDLRQWQPLSHWLLH